MAAYATTHGERIKQELQAAGVKGIGLLRFSIRYLPNLISKNEHIQAVAYGRYRVGEGSKAWNWEEGTLVATNVRVIFVDRKPGFLHTDSTTYDGVSAAQVLTAWPFSEVTLRSRVGTFSLRYVKIALAERFVGYVEQRRIA
jgi:hypothetical protein